MEKTEKELWKLIENAKWAKDHNYKRIALEFKELPKEVFVQLNDFIHSKIDNLYVRFKEDWLGNPGIDCSDDGWFDLRAEVVGRGEKFFNKISVQKLQEMAINSDYKENFAYSVQD